MSKTKIYALLNTVSFVFVVAFNYLSNTGFIAEKTIGQVSDDYTTLFTPASFAFAIWGLIYLLLLGFVINQLVVAFKKESNTAFIDRIGPWFIISCLANVAWIYAWLYESIGLSLVCMFTLLVSLLIILVKNNMERYDAPFKEILFLWWPFVVYSGWITVASIANVSVFLKINDWAGFGLAADVWTIVMMLVAGIINLYLIWTRNLREFALVAVWALYAIAVANKDNDTTIEPWALAIAALVAINVAVHGFINFKTNPLYRLIFNKSKD